MPASRTTVCSCDATSVLSPPSSSTSGLVGQKYIIRACLSTSVVISHAGLETRGHGHCDAFALTPLGRRVEFLKLAKSGVGLGQAVAQELDAYSSADGFISKEEISRLTRTFVRRERFALPTV